MAATGFEFPSGCRVEVEFIGANIMAMHRCRSGTGGAYPGGTNIAGFDGNTGYFTCGRCGLNESFVWDQNASGEKNMAHLARQLAHAGIFDVERRL